MKKRNLHVEIVNSFDDEWASFDQTALSKLNACGIFNEYFTEYFTEYSLETSRSTGLFFDMCLILRSSTFSMQGVAPIKLGEYLLCGLPIVATAGIGDTRAVTEDVGYLLQRMDDEELESAAAWFSNTVLPSRDEISSRARAVGLKEFSLEVSAATYERALQCIGTKQ